jgi:hypothetical protein
LSLIVDFLQVNMLWCKKISNQYFRNGERMKTFQRLTLTAILAASTLFVAGCSGNGPAETQPATSTIVSPSAASPSPSASPTNSSLNLPAGIIAKGVASDGKGVYLQTSIADTDPAMIYNPAITDDAAKAHYSEADLAEAQKVIVKFIAEEAIDSNLNDGTDIDGWYAAHKDEILPANQAIMLADMKTNKGVVAREDWMAAKPGYSYVHGANTPRVKSRTITPTKFRFVEGGGVQGVMLDTTVSYSMNVTGGAHTNVQSTNGDVSFAVAKDPVDGKWKIAGYNTAYHTAEG